MKVEGNLTFCDNFDEVKKELLKRNREWRESSENVMDYNDSMKTIILSCMDSRVPVEKLFGLKPGEALVLKNAGNIITEDVIRSVLVGILEIHAENVIVLGHTRCGMAIKNNEQTIHHLLSHLPSSFRDYFKLKNEEKIINWFGFFNEREWEKNARENAEKLKNILTSLFGEKAPHVEAAVYDLDTREVSFL